MTDELSKIFSPLCLDKTQRVPRRELASSLAAGWTSLLVQTFENPAAVEAFETSPTPDLNLVLIARGTREIESFSGGRWKKATLQPGDGGMTAGGRTNRLRLSAPTSETVHTINIYIPAYYFAAAAEEYRRAGTSSRLEQPDSLAFNDPIVSHTAFSLLEAIKTGAPNLYAESAAQFLAAHLLAKNSRWRAPITAARNPGELNDLRLKRVLEFMRQHCAENLTLDQLAAEAGISRFHFITLFKQAIGITPHQYLIRLRLERAAELLEETDLSIRMIATSCGFVALSHFSDLFRRYFGQTASEYRRTSLSSILPKKSR